MSVTISMPQLGETVTEGTILAWVKEIGDYVAEDDILVEISTDKVDTEIPSPAHGVLTEILVAAGTTIDVGTPIAILSDEGEKPSAGSAEQLAEEEVSDEVVEIAVDVEPKVENRERRGIVSPVVRKLAAEHNVDLAMVPGTGDGGRITRKDIESFIQGQPLPGSSQPLAAAKPRERTAPRGRFARFRVFAPSSLRT
jgi:pyruvate/2-oxoglutarate dehydrogenase complex dihydrolipoamide acyltransferase (E2) component